MSFESVYKTSYGTPEVTKITDFIASLSIKDRYTAEKYETTESESNYHNNYYRPYYRVDSFYDYTLTELRKINETAKIRGLGIDDGYLQGTEQFVQFSLNEMYENGNQTLINFLEYCRNYKIINYVEYNRYYAQYDGYPLSTDQIILVRNFDSDDPEAKIPIHQITQLDTPTTYRNVFVLNSMEDTGFGFGINYYRNLHPDYIYLRFIDKKPLYLVKSKPADEMDTVDYFLLRTCPNYTILNWSDDILTDSEMKYFNKSYSKAVTLVEKEYLKSFEERFPFYNMLLMINLLRYTVLFYTNSYIERYSLHDYSLQNIYNILDSNNLSRLKDINDKNKLYKLIRILDDLIIVKGSEEALKKVITDVLGEDLEALRICYLQKEYNVDNFGRYVFDTNEPYTNPKLVIKETSLKDATNLTEVYHDYDEFVSDDPLWGGGYDEFAEINSDLKAKVKEAILSNSIDNIQTKHLIFRKVVNILKLNIRQNDVVGMLLKYLNHKYGVGSSSNPLHSAEIDFDGIRVSPAILFATSSYLFGLFEWKKYPYSITNSENGIIRDDSLIPDNQYTAIRKYYSVFFDDPASRHEEIENLLTLPITANDKCVISINGDGVKVSTLRDILFCYSLIWDMFIPGLTDLSNQQYIYGAIMNLLGKQRVDMNNNVDGAWKYVETLKPKLVQIVSHLYTNYNDSGEITDDNYFDNCVKRYKEGVYPVSFTGKSNDLYLYDESNLKIPVCRDNELYSDVVSEFDERLSRTTNQSQYIMWDFLERNNMENPNVISSFLDISKGVGEELVKYDNLISFIRDQSESFAAYLYKNGIIKYDPFSGGFAGYSLHDVDFENIETRGLFVDKIIEFEKRCNEKLREWIQTNCIYNIISSTDQLSDQGYIDDVRLLIEEFVSIFKELKQIVYDVDSDMSNTSMISMCSDLCRISITDYHHETNDFMYTSENSVVYKSYDDHRNEIGISQHECLFNVKWSDDDSDIIYDDPMYQVNSYRIHQIFNNVIEYNNNETYEESNIVV